MVETTRTPPCLCPECGSKLDASTGLVGEDTPSPGDVSICLQCGIFLMYGDDLRSRRLTLAEFYELPPEIQAVLKKAATIRNKVVPNDDRPAGALH